MIIAKRLKGKAIAAWLGPTGDAARRAVDARQAAHHQRARAASTSTSTSRIRGATSTAQAVARLVEAYPGRASRSTSVTPPASDVDPAPDAARQARACATPSSSPSTGTSSSPARRKPTPGMVRDVGTALDPRAARRRAAARRARARRRAVEPTTRRQLADAARHVGHRVARRGRADPQHELRRAAQGRSLPGRDAALRRRPGTGASIACPTSRPRSRATSARDVAHVVHAAPRGRARSARSSRTSR